VLAIPALHCLAPNRGARGRRRARDAAEWCVRAGVRDPLGRPPRAVPALDQRHGWRSAIRARRSAADSAAVRVPDGDARRPRRGWEAGSGSSTACPSSAQPAFLHPGTTRPRCTPCWTCTAPPTSSLSERAALSVESPTPRRRPPQRWPDSPPPPHSPPARKRQSANASPACPHTHERSGPFCNLGPTPARHKCISLKEGVVEPARGEIHGPPPRAAIPPTKHPPTPTRALSVLFQAPGAVGVTSTVLRALAPAVRMSHTRNLLRKDRLGRALRQPRLRALRLRSGCSSSLLPAA
jgi:hypothetical protein